MRESTKNQIARSILPYAATLLSLSLAVTLRVEHSCIESPAPAQHMVPHAVYPFSEIALSTKPDPAVSSVRIHQVALTKHPQKLPTD